MWRTLKRPLGRLVRDSRIGDGNFGFVVYADVKFTGPFDRDWRA